MISASYSITWNYKGNAALDNKNRLLLTSLRFYAIRSCMIYKENNFRNEFPFYVLFLVILTISN